MLLKAPGGARSAAGYREHQVHVQSEFNIQHESAFSHSYLCAIGLVGCKYSRHARFPGK